MKIKEINEILKGEIKGEQEIEIKGILPPEENKEGFISVVYEKKYSGKEFYAVITDRENAKDINFKSAIIVDNPREKLIQILNLFDEEEEKKDFIHETAVVSEKAKIEEDVYIGPYCVIGDNVIIKRGTKLVAFVYVGKNSVIGENNTIYPFVSIEKNVETGKNCIIHSGTVLGSDGFGYQKKGDKIIKIPQVGKVKIADDVELGANVCVDRATMGNTYLGNQVKIDNLCQIAHNVKIGERTIIASQSGIAGSSEIGNDVLIAGQVGIKDHVKIGDRAILTAKTGVSKDVPERKIYSGYFAREHKLVLKAMNILYELPRYWEKLKKLVEKNETD